MSSDRPVVALDVDGVMTDHNSGFMDILNQENGTDHHFDDITAFSYPNLTAEEKERVFELWHTPDLYDQHPPQQGCLEAISELRDFYRVLAVSSPLLGHIASKYRWLMEVAAFDRRDIVLASDKALVKANILVDDAAHNLEEFPGPSICFDRPWNRGWPGPRVTSWMQVLDTVDRVLSRVTFSGGVAG